MLNVDKKKVLTLFAVAMLTASMLLASMKIQAGALPWYEKPAHPDYAPSGMPDFEQHQDMWGVPGQPVTYTWCGPVAVANSLWWLDSEYESIYCPSPVPPPTISDHFQLVTSYNPAWDDHDPRNLDLLVHRLAFLMDTDGMRTTLPHQGTNYIDMQTGISQYLQEQRVNPAGDCDGDGDVDDADIGIIEDAFGSVPGSINWDMRADIVINNKVDMADITTAGEHYGETGMFYEHTQDFPEFHWVEEEILRCEDVVLFLEFWQYVPGYGWYRLYEPEFEAGHFVTSAGVNSTTLQITISDPYWDAAEAGFPGYVPVPHISPHPASKHNDTQYVSHDAYTAVNWPSVPPSPYGPGPQVWELVNYLQQLGYDQSYHAFVRAAIVTSPLVTTHDVAVTDVYSSLASVYQGDIDPIIVTVTNEGDYTETVNVDAYYDGNKAAPTQTISMNKGDVSTRTFLWDTTGVPLGSYQVSATATIAVDDDPSDNSRLGNWEEVTKLPWYEKPRYPDYAPSGMPDFDEKQDNWGVGQVYTWCGPVSVANSLWWLDSEYESLYTPSPVPPPTISDHYPLVTSYQPQLWDDHDPRNLDPLVHTLAFLMDTDGMRTGLIHTGTSYIDMETGLSQYLQQQGVNPQGDCDGDGDVDINDAAIVQAAMGSIPGAPNWDMRADIVITNSVDLMDAAVVAANIGRTGMFYEHTQDYPEFYWIEDEIYRCQDVVLYLEFAVEDPQMPGYWSPFYDIPSFEAGHFVTCAGVNSTIGELLISDPWWDAAEAGYPGHVPVPHPAGHPSTLHNDTLYVSHDDYGVVLWPAQMSPYGLPVYELANYLVQLGFPPNYHAFIRAAVVTSPLGEHDVAVTDIVTSKTGCLPKETLGDGKPIDINVTVTNEGDFTETFTVRLWANNTMLAEITVVDLMPAQSKVIPLWDDEIIGGTKGSIRIMANCTIVTGETDTADNTRVYGYIFKTLAGDVDGNRVVNIFDIVRMAGAYGAKRGQPKYDPNSDIDNNGIINIFDIVAAAGNYGKSW